MIALTWMIDVPLAMDMSGVRAVAQSTGDSLENSPGLLAGVTCVSEAGADGSMQNTIALLSVWANTSRMSEFLWGEATAQVERKLARPSARIWTVSSVQLDRARFSSATHAGVFIRPRIGDFVSEYVKQQRDAAAKAAAGRSTALACRGLDPNSWEDVSVDAWVGRPRSYSGRVLNVVRAIANPLNNHP